MPNPGNSGLMFTNAGWKALAIGYTTALNYPASLITSNLTVESPTNSFNTFMLNYVGVGSPLQIRSYFYLGSNSVFLTLASALQIGEQFLIDGTVNHGASSEVSTTNLYLGVAAGPGVYNMSNGVLTASNIILGGWLRWFNNSFNQEGGSTRATRITQRPGSQISFRGDSLVRVAEDFIAYGPVNQSQSSELIASNVFLSYGSVYSLSNSLLTATNQKLETAARTEPIQNPPIPHPKNAFFQNRWRKFCLYFAKSNKTEQIRIKSPMFATVQTRTVGADEETHFFGSPYRLGVFALHQESNKTERSAKFQKLDHCARGTCDDAFTNRSIFRSRISFVIWHSTFVVCHSTRSLKI